MEGRHGVFRQRTVNAGGAIRSAIAVLIFDESSRKVRARRHRKYVQFSVEWKISRKRVEL